MEAAREALENPEKELSWYRALSEIQSLKPCIYVLEYMCVVFVWVEVAAGTSRPVTVPFCEVSTTLVANCRELLYKDRSS